MRKNLAYRDLTAHEAYDMEEILYKEIEHLDMNHPIRLLFMEALWNYKINKWKYDGPTFSMAYKSFWEIPAFIHDWRNSMGYVSRKVDEEMFSIMILLNYPLKYIIQRWFLTTLTPLNILRHYFKGTLKKENPSNLFLL
jgi:hypothetical protein